MLVSSMAAYGNERNPGFGWHLSRGYARSVSTSYSDFGSSTFSFSSVNASNFC